MNSTEPIIITAYLLCLLYFLNKIKNAFNDEYTIVLNEDELKQSLSEHGLQEIISISFKFNKRYEFNKQKDLGISIENKSKRDSIYVDWDCSTFTDLDGRSRRVTRLMPGMTLDLFQKQVFSTIAPETTLKESITAEDLLQRKGARDKDKLDKESPLNLEVEVTKPLINLSKPDGKAPDAVKKRYERFMKRQIDLNFSLELAFRLVGPDRKAGGKPVQILCKFILKKLPWAAGLPWNPKG